MDPRPMGPCAPTFLQTCACIYVCLVSLSHLSFMSLLSFCLSCLSCLSCFSCLSCLSLKKCCHPYCSDIRQCCPPTWHHHHRCNSPLGRSSSSYSMRKGGSPAERARHLLVSWAATVQWSCFHCPHGALRSSLASCATVSTQVMATIQETHPW